MKFDFGRKRRCLPEQYCDYLLAIFIQKEQESMKAHPQRKSRNRFACIATALVSNFTICHLFY